MAVQVSVGSDIQTLVNAAPTGETFYIGAGVHRLQEIKPKAGQIFIGEEGAVLNGSQLITSFTKEGSNWVISGQTQEGLRKATDDPAPGAMRGGYPETVFINDKPLKPVDELSKVTSGMFYFDYAADKIYIADDPTGKKVEAGKASLAFSGNASGVTVQNITIEKYSNPIQSGAIQGGENWTIQDNEVRLNYAVGITGHSGTKILDNYVHGNGNMGIGGTGNNLLVENNEISKNGHWSGVNPNDWEGGGAKFGYTDGLTVRGNYVHDNDGFGLWTDVDTIHTTYENNLLVGNIGGGIKHELSFDATIRDNTLIGNGYFDQGGGTPGNPVWLWGTAILLQNSKNVDIYGNKVDMTNAGNGIGLIDQDRGAGSLGPWVTTGNKVHNNEIVKTAGHGRSGGAADYNGSVMLKSDNLFDNNEYYMSQGDNWWWGDFPSGDNWDAYMRDTNQDEHSTVSQAYPDTSVWVTDWHNQSPTNPHSSAPSAQIVPGDSAWLLSL